MPTHPVGEQGGRAGHERAAEDDGEFALGHERKGGACGDEHGQDAADDDLFPRAPGVLLPSRVQRGEGSEGGEHRPLRTVEDDEHEQRDEDGDGRANRDTVRSGVGPDREEIGEKTGVRTLGGHRSTVRRT